MTESRKRSNSLCTIHALAEPVTESGCWIWNGTINNRGYGHIGFHGKLFMAHRLFFELYNGPILPGFQINHLCRVKCCVNPSHLESVTAQQNMLYGPTSNTLKTHCRCGRPYDLLDSQGRRRCKTCKYLRHEEWRSRNREHCNQSSRANYARKVPS